MTVSVKQIYAALAVIAVGMIPMFLNKDVGQYTLAVSIIAAIVNLLASSGGGGANAPIVEAIRRAANGERPMAPADASPDVARIIEEISGLVDTQKRREQDGAQRRAAVAGLGDAVRRALAGERVVPTDDIPTDVARVYDELGRFVDLRRREEAEEQTRKNMYVVLTDAVKRAWGGEHTSAPQDAPNDLIRLYDELRNLVEARRKEATDLALKKSEIDQSEWNVEEAGKRLADNMGNALAAVDETSGVIRDLAATVREVASHVESLTGSADESTSSVREIAATNDEVVENVIELASSVKDGAKQMEEMHASIKEVARSVEMLSQTAEETSSSMNEMDVSIAQVQSNANETARLSEEVALDAEKGAEAILKTLSEMYRIKESSQEAVAVISNLGSRIEAIGQIINVIDDVAEQTNLLALNAAIIAAQAGEQGKGFAVVADEIKELAERAGASTREITDLVKTVQAESRNAIAAVERGNHNVDRGVEVSNEAERALKKILESSQKSTNMVRAIARATVEQAKGSKQVTDAIGRIAETMQQIAAATQQQTRASDIILKSSEKMRIIASHVERSSQAQARGSKQLLGVIEHISNMVRALNQSERSQLRSSEQLIAAVGRIEDAVRGQDGTLKQLMGSIDRLKKSL